MASTITKEMPVLTNKSRNFRKSVKRIIGRSAGTVLRGKSVFGRATERK